MNREILFRGKRTDNGEWAQGFYMESILREKKYFIVADLLSEEMVAVDPDTVGQFTGLLDKEGDKIFEGDILRTMSGIAVVVWRDAAFALKSPGSEAVDWEHSSVFEQSEILGNIHQTPELLNQQQ